MMASFQRIQKGSHIASPLRSVEFTRNERNFHCDVLHFTPDRVVTLVLDDAIAAMEDVIKIIHNLKPKSSCGFDEISVKLIKFAKNELCKPITVIVNQCLETGIFPDKLKIAKVIPLFKKGDPEQIDNYRPISILPAISKIIENTIFIQLYEYFNTNDLLYKSQYGFRPKHSAELAALEIVDKIIYQMDNSETPISVLLDLSKAFDKKSVLGPALFVIYTAQIAEITREHLLLAHFYADDSQLYVAFSPQEPGDEESIARKVSACLKDIRRWMLANMLKQNDEKTEFIIACPPRIRH